MNFCSNISKGNKHLFYIALILFIILFLFNFFSCSNSNNPLNDNTGYQYEVPVQTDDGWETATLSSVGMNETPFVDLMNDLDEIDNHRIHSLLIIKDDRLVFEEYFPGDRFNLGRFTGERGFDRITTHDLCSATKSFVSALIGIAVDQGFIQSVDQYINDFFPEYSDIFNATPEKNDITIHHLLTMSSGLEWDDETYPYEDPRNDIYQLFSRSDPIRYILSKDLIEVPGSTFAYRNCNTNLLGEIIRRATGSRIDDFADENLFGYLGITDREWQMLRNDVVFCSGDLRLRPRDMAKFGLLFLNGGIWNNEQIISNGWIDISTQTHFNPNIFTNNFPWADGYGYQWWIWEDINGTEFDAYFASGWGGQWIVAWPSENMVIVSTAGNYYTEISVPLETIITDYILPSVLQN